MNVEFARHFLLWSTIINYGVLVAWFLFFTLGHDTMRRVHARWFRIPEEQFDVLHYAGMAVFKIGILLFNLTPLVVFLVVW